MLERSEASRGAGLSLPLGKEVPCGLGRSIWWGEASLPLWKDTIGGKDDDSLIGKNALRTYSINPIIIIIIIIRWVFLIPSVFNRYDG
jgi:hypothetical protein